MDGQVAAQAILERLEADTFEGKTPPQRALGDMQRLCRGFDTEIPERAIVLEQVTDAAREGGLVGRAGIPPEKKSIKLNQKPSQVKKRRIEKR